MKFRIHLPFKTCFKYIFWTNNDQNQTKLESGICFLGGKVVAVKYYRVHRVVPEVLMNLHSLVENIQTVAKINIKQFYFFPQPDDWWLLQNRWKMHRVMTSLHIVTYRGPEWWRIDGVMRDNLWIEWNPFLHAENDCVSMTPAYDGTRKQKNNKERGEHRRRTS